MYVIQKWNPTRRPATADDGPPYGPPGMWSTIIRKPSEDEANASLKHLLTPWPGETPRDETQYRVIDEATALREEAALNKKYTRKPKLLVAA